MRRSTGIAICSCSKRRTLARRVNETKVKKTTGATVGYEAELWRMADALRGSMDAAEYKHVVLGLIFLKYISDAFEEQYARLEAERSQGADPEDPDEYRAVNIFWVPPEARWARLKANALEEKMRRLVAQLREQQAEAARLDEAIWGNLEGLGYGH